MTAGERFEREEADGWAETAALYPVDETPCHTGPAAHACGRCWSLLTATGPLAIIEEAS